MIDPVDPLIDDGLLAQTSLRGGAITTVAQIVRFAIRLTSQIVIARLLLPSDYGLVAMVAPVLALVSLVGNLGLGQSIIQQRHLTHEQVSSLFWIGLAVNILLAAVLIAAAPAVAWVFREPRLTLLVSWSALLIPLSGLGSQQAALFTRNMRFGLLAVGDVLPSALGLLAGLTAAVAHWGYWSLVVLAAVEALTGSIVLWALSSWRPGRPRYDRRIFGMVRVGGHITGYNLANFLTTTADNVILGIARGDVALGLYNKGYGVVTQPLSQLMSPFDRAAVPLFVRLATDEQRYRNAFRRIAQLMLILAWPGIIATMLTATPLMLFLLGDQWVRIGPIVSWLCLGALAVPLYSSAYWLFVSQGRTGQQVNYAFATSLLSIAGFVVGLPWGAAGVAAGASISFFFVSTPMTWWGVTRHGPVKFAMLAGYIAPILVAASMSAVGLRLLTSHVVVHGPAWLLLCFGLSYAIFLAALAMLPAGRCALSEVWGISRLLRRRSSIAEAR